MTEEKPKAPGVFSGLTQRQIGIGAVILLFFLVLGVLGFKWFRSDALAVLVEMKGGPDRDHSASVGDWIAAEVGDDFESGDGARTGQKESAFFRLGTGARLELKPASQIRFQGQAGKGGTIGLKVEVGEADIRTNEGTLMIDSEFGPIVVDKNSAVTMRRDGARMALSVELGSIELGDSKRNLAAGDSIDLEIGGIVVEEAPPEPEPAPVAPEEEPLKDELKVGDGVTSPDLIVSAGDNFVVHDPEPPTKIGFDLASVCKGPGELRSGKKVTQAEKRAALAFDSGVHPYEVRCLDAPDRVAARGTVRVLRDSGTRKLPTFTPQANVATDGRVYTVMYQQKLPQVTVTWPSAPAASSFKLQIGGRVITTNSPSYTFSSLSPGTHQLTFSADSDPPRKSRTTTVTVSYDSQAPAARVALPDRGFQSGESVTVSGQALPGWTVSVDGKELEMDGQRRFSADSATKGTVPIAFSHPTHGMHYYLRRPR